MKGAGMLFVSLRGVNFGFWSQLGCTGQNAIIFSREGHAKKYKNIYLICIFLIHFIYSIHIIQVFSFVCVLTWSLLGVKKAWATPRSVSFRGLIQNFRRASPPLSYARSPPRAQLERIDTINIFFVSFSTEKDFFFRDFTRRRYCLRCRNSK